MLFGPPLATQPGGLNPVTCEVRTWMKPVRLALTFTTPTDLELLTFQPISGCALTPSTPDP